MSLRLAPLALALPVLAAAAPSGTDDKKVLSIDDYALWRSVGSTALSDDGAWIAWSYRKRDTDEELHFEELDGDGEHVIARGSSPVFSDDGKWAAYRVPTPEDDDAKKEQEKPRAALLELATGETLTWDNASSFAFSAGSDWFYVRKSKADSKAEHDGTDVVLRNLGGGYEELLGSVSDLEFNEPGTVLAYTVESADGDGNGLYALYTKDGSRRPLEAGDGTFGRMTWDEDGDGLAALHGTEKDGFERRENVLLAFTGFGKKKPKRHALDASEAFGFPKDMVISELGSLSWADDRSRVFFGAKEQEAEPEKKGDDDEKANVDVWHWQDDRIQSVQMIRASRDRNHTWRCAFDLASGAFTRLADETMRDVSVSRDGRWAVGQDGRAYVSDWRESRNDYYRVDVANGDREPLLTANGRTLGLSPDSRWYLYWKEGDVWAIELESLAHTNLTADAPVDFTNAEFDRPGTKPPYGVEGWTKDGAAVVLRHRYDLYLQPLDGSAATNLTGVGTEAEIRFRTVRTDPDERFLDLSQPILLSSYGQWTKTAGFHELRDGEVHELLFVDKKFGRATKAADADRFVFAVEDFHEAPDLHVSDGTFANPRRITDVNPQQVEYAWGRRVLFDFENKGGVRLQGTLAIPDDHVEGTRRPMLVNYYEKNSQNLHDYPSPRYSSGPQFAGYVSAGYLVMQPDIHFRGGTTHSDMLECVEAATRKVVEMGYADPDRVAVHGHSFSGQGNAYIATHSDMFAAVIAGAAATNLVSDFNQLWKSAGTNQHRYDIHGQGRFGTNPYDDFDLYVEQSAVHHAPNMNTPLLTLHGTDDGSVEWLQAVEFYNALRFNGKEVILLSYPGEGHGLRQFANQKDFQTRMRQFLDHHLRDEPAPDWMTVWVPFLEKDD